MHEASIANMIIKKSIDCIGSNENERITRILVEVGQFRNVDPDSLSFAFNALRKDSKETQEANLEIREVKAKAMCTIGGHLYYPESVNLFCCELCNGGIAELLEGKELNILEVEMDSDSTECLPHI